MAMNTGWMPGDSEKVEKERDRALKKRDQLDHQVQRIENRKTYLEKGERQARTHRLCQRAGAIEALAPATKQLTDPEFYILMERIISRPEWQQDLDWIMANRGKEELYSTLSLPCDTAETE